MPDPKIVKGKKKKWYQRETTTGPFKKIREAIKGGVRKRKKKRAIETLREFKPDVTMPSGPKEILKATEGEGSYKKGGKIRDQFTEQYD
jgi:hypothetical protein